MCLRRDGVVKSQCLRPNETLYVRYLGLELRSIHAIPGEQEQQHRRREDQQEGRHKVCRPLCLHQTSYERTHPLRKPLRGALGEVVEERLESLFGHAWSDAPLETGLDAPCEVRIERQIKGNE